MHAPSQSTRLALAAAVATLIAAPQSVRAAAFAVPELSVAGLGTANAMVANPDEPGAFAYNPAAMAFHEQSTVAVGGILVNPNFSVRTGSGKHDSEGADWIALPLFQAAIRIDEQWSAGLGVAAPFGLETRWERDTFPPLTGQVPLPTPPFAPGTSIPASPQPTASKVEIVDFTPTVTFRVNDELALSAGADIYWAKSAQLDTSVTNLRGDGSGWGFNLSGLYVKDALSLGVNFHSGATVQIEGFYTALNDTMVSIGALPPSQTAKLDLELPWRLSLGIRYEITEQLAAEFDYSRTGWSAFEEIKVESDVSGATLTQDENNWNDSNTYRFGLTYQLLDTTQLRFGYSYDETPVDNAYFSARVPDNDRNLFSLGVAHELSDGWQLEAGYMYVVFNDRKYSGSRPYDPTQPADANGTSALAGKYEAHAHLIGLEISKRFDAF